MKTIDICIHCGQPESEHHIFDPIHLPEGCVCDWRTWGSPPSIPPVCDDYMPSDALHDEHGVCFNCEHDEACHKPNLEKFRQGAQKAADEVAKWPEWKKAGFMTKEEA